MTFIFFIKKGGHDFLRRSLKCNQIFHNNFSFFKNRCLKFQIKYLYSKIFVIEK
jgi:hypothetical protein